ncbi:DUF2061 domain-containing protein [Sulfitobacter guttiformis]|uniref:Putative membrane protein n=1 Tax=Sulfitobacter guttiformis TaxID=74349 RepID=A0A420DH22_9RHOB|nr:DUF2061 domain-containing protein [Sulfitobacter guttiformis]RKE93524.1 putative membrane protein [Sulfitobacter guttiformis]
MDSKIRLFAKAVTWQVAGFFSMMLIGFLFTGSVTASGGIAFFGAVVGFASYFVHELFWSRISWGRGLVYFVGK